MKKGLQTQTWPYAEKEEMLEEELIRNDDANIYRKPTARTIVFIMVLAFVLPVIILALALLKIQVWPGGKFTLLIYDLRAQFVPIISSLRYLGKGDGSIFYSFYGALGNNAFLNYNTYILDPTIWITVLFPLEQMPDAIYFLTLVKIGFCGLGACVFFFFGFKGKKYPFIILALSVCYALTSYNIVYSECILWLNVIMLAPIILLGIEHIMDGKNGGVYVLCMMLSLCYNAQLTYMIGLFSVLYLVYRLSETESNRLRIIIRFITCNILCVGMYMPVILPVFFNIRGGRLAAGTPTIDRYYYTIWDLLKQFLSCQYTTIESGGLPNLFCGTFIPLIALLIVVLPLKPIISRVISACICVFFMISFCIVRLNQFWHGFNEPNAYPARYSFLLCLFLILLAYQVICFAFQKLSLTKSVFYTVNVLVMIITCTEMYLNTGYILTSLNLEKKYLINSEYQLQLREIKSALNGIDDGDFYRIGRDLMFTYNDGMLFGYNGIGYFSSMFERRTMDFIGKLGYSQNEHVLTGAGGTPVSESILGVKYKVLQEPELFGYYEDMDCEGSYNLQYNNNALPLGFLTKYREFDYSSSDDLIGGLNDHNAFVFQECVLSELRGKRVHAFEQIEYTVEDVESDIFERYVRIKFTATSDKPVWIYCKDEHGGFRVIARNDMGRSGGMPSSDFVSAVGSDSTKGSLDPAFLKVNGEPRYPFADRISTMCIYLGTFKIGEEVEVEAACVKGFDDPWLAYYNADECEAALQEIKKTGMEVIEHRNGVIKGRINVQDEDDLMVMTLPAMKGYKVRVDGTKTEYGAYREALFALKMEPGWHTIEISFIPYGLIPGTVIGLVSLFITVVYFIFKHGNKNVKGVAA